MVTGRFQDTLQGVLQERAPVDYAFIDGHHDEHATLRYFDQIHPHLAETALVIFDDVAWSAGMRRAWDALQADERIRTVLDLGAEKARFLKRSAAGVGVRVGELHHGDLEQHPRVGDQDVTHGRSRARAHRHRGVLVRRLARVRIDPGEGQHVRRLLVHGQEHLAVGTGAEAEVRARRRPPALAHPVTQDRDHLVASADHTDGGAGDRAPPGRTAGAGRHSRDPPG